MNKKILIMRGYYFPETAASNQMCLEIAQKFSENEFNVEILSPIPTRGVDNYTRNKYKNNKYEKISDSFYIKRYWLPKERNSILLRTLRYILQNIYQLCYGLFHKYDILFLYSTPPTNGIVGACLRKFKKVKFIYNLHDVFPDSLISSGIASKESLLFKLGKIIENETYKNADKILVISNEIKQNIVNKGVEEKKISLVYNWVDESKIFNISRDCNSLAKLLSINNNDFVITYAGNIGEAQSIETIIEAARNLENFDKIKFVIIGNGASEEKCKNSAKGIKNIYFLPMQPISKLTEVYSLGDASIISCKKGFGGCGMPSKFGSITASGTALIASFDLDSELSSIVRKYNLGICVEPENSKMLSDAILDLFTKKIKCKEFGNNGRKFILEHMTKDICTNSILKIVKDVSLK